ncbi:hypothetical protein TNCV_3510611 [Trichonephila clavipes]|nr:hypothetical protein TNCV_3510611 [Trichonephila clavipes]
MSLVPWLHFGLFIKNAARVKRQKVNSRLVITCPGDKKFPQFRRRLRARNMKLYERRVGGYPLHLRPRQRKWTCCRVVWKKVTNEAATESSNVESSASKPGET